MYNLDFVAVTPPLPLGPFFLSCGRSPECNYLGDNIYQFRCEMVMEENLGKLSLSLLSLNFPDWHTE